jgi:hypothetical protein
MPDRLHATGDPANPIPSELQGTDSAACTMLLVGHPVRTVTLPAEIDCASGGFSHIAISVATVPASDVGFAGMGGKALLATSWRNSSTGNTIYFHRSGLVGPSRDEGVPALGGLEDGLRRSGEHVNRSLAEIQPTGLYWVKLVARPRDAEPQVRDRSGGRGNVR